jgi:hypothetical protein
LHPASHVNPEVLEKATRLTKMEAASAYAREQWKLCAKHINRKTAIYSVIFDRRPSMDMMNKQVDAFGNRLIGFLTKRNIGQGVI